jgi:hypothetical protein
LGSGPGQCYSGAVVALGRSRVHLKQPYQCRMMPLLGVWHACLRECRVSPPSWEHLLVQVEMVVSVLVLIVGHPVAKRHMLTHPPARLGIGTCVLAHAMYGRGTCQQDREQCSGGARLPTWTIRCRVCLSVAIPRTSRWWSRKGGTARHCCCL